jgi:hypothetical protein
MFTAMSRLPSVVVTPSGRVSAIFTLVALPVPVFETVTVYWIGSQSSTSFGPLLTILSFGWMTWVVTQASSE